MSIMRSAIKLDVLKKYADGQRLAMPDYGNMSGLIRVPKAIPAVTLRVVNSYENKIRVYDKVHLFAYDNTAYSKLCELITEATQHSYYEPRIEEESLRSALADCSNLFAIVNDEYPYPFYERMFLSVNANSNLHASVYKKQQLIYFYESFALDKDGFKVIESFPNARIDNLLAYHKCEEHYKIAYDFTRSTILNYEMFMNMKLDALHFGDKLPVFSDDDDGLFQSLVMTGFRRKYPKPTSEQISRLEFELAMIRQMGFPSYFLIVWDFIHWAREHDIAIGPGRGSAAGSIVAYCLDITQLCPLEHGLYFERFLNPERISMPDIDVDISQNRRKEVMDYLELRYGKERVCQIINFGLLKSKMAFKDACRVEGVSAEEANDVTKLWPPAKFGVTPTLGEVQKFDKIQDWINTHKVIWDRALLMENFVRQEGVHAAGVVIAPTKVTNYAPVTYKNDIRLCQFNKDDAEKYGLLKMDLLGLKNLDILQKAAELAGIEFYKLYDMKLDDPAVFERFKLGDTHGVFQFESKGMQSLLKRIQPDKFDDLSAATALFRPGPLQGGLTDEYVSNKHSQEREYFIPEFETLLADTYGTFVYQEQIMKIVRELAGFSMPKADTLRKAIGKKNKELMASLKDEFINGAIEHGYDADKMDALWTKIEGFGDYCFNKSHSAAYSLISYYCMWFKVYHPNEFALALLSMDMADSNKMAEHFFHFSKDIDFEYPKFNQASTDFTIIDNKLVLGLGTIKELNDTEPYTRQFKDLVEFLELVELDKTKLTQLINSGFFDNIEERAVMYGNLEYMLKYSKDSKQSRKVLLFDFSSCAVFELDKTKKRMINKAKAEIDAYGFNIKEAFIVKNTKIIECFPSDFLVGIVRKIKRVKTRKDAKDMAILTVYSLKGEIDMLMFPDSYDKFGTTIVDDETYIFKFVINPPRDNFDESYVIQGVGTVDPFIPKSVLIMDDFYREENKKRISLKPMGQIEVWYEGPSFQNDESESIGFIDEITPSFMKLIPKTAQMRVIPFID